jgi:hypothetical protein
MNCESSVLESTPLGAFKLYMEGWSMISIALAKNKNGIKELGCNPRERCAMLCDIGVMQRL